MRSSLVCVLIAFATTACGGGGSGPPGGDDDDQPDAGDEPPPPERGFRIQSPDIDIQPGQEITYCFYFRTPNTEPMAVNKWASNMTPGSHHMIMYLTGDTDQMPPGTVSSSSCGIGAGFNAPVWTYAAQTPTAEVLLPPDDGAGKPLAQEIPPNTAGFFQMHYLNATDEVIKAHVTLDASALDAGAAFTSTAAYITFAFGISIPPGAIGDVERRTNCTASPNSKFWMLSTHAHKQAVKTEILDGNDVIFSSTDWEHPGEKTFMTPETFFSFSSGKVTYACTYDNTGDNANRTISTGDSADRDEMCMATGYFFPATQPSFCLSPAE